MSGRGAVPGCGAVTGRGAALRVLAALLAVAACGACGGAHPAQPHLAREQLLDPGTCGGCHQEQYAQWALSGHAGAADDPVFIAMNARGQRDSQGALGTFCVNCHAPMAVREGRTTDGLNLAGLPDELRGVTCYYCHSVAAVTGTHNNPLQAGNDTLMRGAFSDPIANIGHPSAYATLMDRDQSASSALCGSCHDIHSQPGVPVERTFEEWQGSAFAQDPHQGGQSCSHCHMAESATAAPVAQVAGAPPRRRHDHTFPAIDVSLDPNFTGAAAQRAANQALLDTSLQTGLCVVQEGSTASLRVVLDNVAAGHNFPSGAAQDRRTWVEVVAYQNDQVIYQSGVVADGNAVVDGADPDLWLLRECDYDAAGNLTPHFWEAQAAESNTLPVINTFDQTAPTSNFFATHIEQRFPRAGTATLPAMPDRVTLRVRLRPIGLDVLDDLIAGGDLDAAVRARTITYDIGAPALLEWTAAAATRVTPPLASGQLAPAQLCVTQSAINLAAQRTPAAANAHCTP